MQVGDAASDGGEAEDEDEGAESVGVGVDEGDGIVAALDADDPNIIFRSREISSVRLVRDTFEAIGAPDKNYDRMIAYCPLAAHGRRCMKRRAIGVAQQADLGPRQPIAYLCCWALRAEDFPDQASHLRYAPTLRDQREWLRANPGI